MDLEIARVGREMYKAFSGLNEGFEEVDKLTIALTIFELMKRKRKKSKMKKFISFAEAV